MAYLTAWRSAKVISKARKASRNLSRRLRPLSYLFGQCNKKVRRAFQKSEHTSFLESQVGLLPKIEIFEFKIAVLSLKIGAISSTPVRDIKKLSWFEPELLEGDVCILLQETYKLF